MTTAGIPLRPSAEFSSLELRDEPDWRQSRVSLHFYPVKLQGTCDSVSGILTTKLGSRGTPNLTLRRRRPLVLEHSEILPQEHLPSILCSEPHTPQPLCR